MIFKAGRVVLWCNGKPAKPFNLHRFCAHLPKHELTVKRFYDLDNCTWEHGTAAREAHEGFVGAVISACDIRRAGTKGRIHGQD